MRFQSPRSEIRGRLELRDTSTSRSRPEDESLSRPRLIHRLEVPLHAVYRDCDNVREAQVLGKLGEHGLEHA